MAQLVHFTFHKNVNIITISLLQLFLEFSNLKLHRFVFLLEFFYFSHQSVTLAYKMLLLVVGLLEIVKHLIRYDSTERIQIVKEHLYAE